MLEELEESMDAFTAKDLRTAERVIKTLAEKKLDPAELFRFNEFVLDQEKIARKKFNELGKANVVAGKKSNSPKKERVRPKHPILAPGQTELSEMISPCCKEKVLVEAVCPSTIHKLGCVRICFCSGCNKEFKIR